MISGIIKVEVTLTETLIISDITKTESNNCFMIHCFKANNDKCIIALNTTCSYFAVHELDIALGNHALYVHPTSANI